MIYEALVQSLSNALAVPVNDVKTTMLSKACTSVERDKNGMSKATQPLAKDRAYGLRSDASSGESLRNHAIWSNIVYPFERRLCVRQGIRHVGHPAVEGHGNIIK
jgi:hypothetical protein